MMVVSGVAAVSAYEAHIINVSAHVENAVAVETTAVSFGTVFPEEWLIAERNIALSESANTALTEGGAAGTLVSVDYKICAEWKVDPDAGTPANHIPDVIYPPLPDPNAVDYYEWMGPWLWVGIDATAPTTDLSGWTQVGAAPAMADMAKDIPGVTGILNAGNKDDTLAMMLLAPCFHGYWNGDTDVKPEWWPTPETPAWPFAPAVYRDGYDIGLDMKVQITGITRTPN